MKKIISIVLASVIVSSGVLFSACEDKGVKTEPGTKATTDNVTTAEEEKWPDRDCDGAKLKILVRDDQLYDFEIIKDSDDPIDIALDTRNNWLEDKYKFSIEYHDVPRADYITNARTFIQSGSDEYNFFIGPGANLSTLAQEGSLLDLASLSNIDLSKPWWDKCATRDLSIANRVFMTTGALQTCDIGGTYNIFFNKVALEENNLENPYELVYNNKWTLDKFWSMCKGVQKDLNDDGKLTETDQFGYVCENYDGYAMFFASGETIVGKDDKDLITLTVYNDRASEVVSKLNEFYTDECTFVNSAAIIKPIIADGRAVFCGTILAALPTYRAMEDDFGILPLPKYEDTQENYVTPVSSGMTGSLVGIPNNVENPELTSFMVEMMTRKSLDTLRVAYYDVVAKNQSMRDEDSVKMLDIIIGSRVFDPYFINTWVDNTWYYFFAWHVAEMPNNVQFSSQYDKQKDATEKAIQNTIDTYMSYIEG